MKYDKELNEQVDEENQTQEGGAKKSTINAKNYTSRCAGLGLHKMFTTLPEEEKGVLRATCFIPLLLIDPIATMSTLVVEIFDRHLGDMKFQFGETIIQMKPIHVCLILGLGVSPIVNEFLFVDPEHMRNFRMRRFPKKKNIYGLKEIDEALKYAKLERHLETSNRSTCDCIAPAVGELAIGSSSFTTEIGVVVVRAYEERVQRKMMSLQTHYFGNQSLSLPTPIPVPPTFHGMTLKEVEERMRWRRKMRRRGSHLRSTANTLQRIGCCNGEGGPSSAAKVDVMEEWWD
ncbi:hypothetical protein GIB67_031001 [Kingdonia uniflora]|uniref:Uncharacterized protein n=1 Tax=Kingdonia uniflora TaxID=39325 RepID=A0A7J7NGD0_9MAGN|nr:hypothetical protein GIB67_031001 [Kingdonia uniflora]